MPHSRLALKLALAVTAAAAVLAGGAFLWEAASGAPLPGWALAVAVVLTGAAAYAAAYRLTTRRLKRVQASLRRVRRHEFEYLEAHPLDGSARKDELDALAEEVDRTGRTLEEEISELRKMENYRREFIGNVSHELKTPIFSVRGFAETLLDGALEDESVRRSFVEKILRNADRLGHLARDLAEIARIETGEQEMTVAPFALRPLGREVIESMEPVAAGKDVTIEAPFPDDLPPVEGDRERIRRVLTNLVDNAVKYNEPGGSVTVSARPAPEGGIEVYVRDDGIGVAPEHVERLTERFYRVDQSRSRSQGGTGLGLAIVKHILGAHGSRLAVSSNPDHGSTFAFTLAEAQETEDHVAEEQVA